MPGEQVDKLQRAYERFEPDDSISRHAWLFSHAPELPEPPGRDWQAKEQAVETARLQALREVHAQGGLASLLEMTARVEQAGELGRTLGKNEMLTDEEDALLGRELCSSDDPRRYLARGFIVGRRQALGWPWIEAKLSEAAPNWSPEQRAEFFACLTFEGRTWDLLETTNDETQHLYWTQVGPYGLSDAAERERAVTKFLEHDRPHEAMGAIVSHLEDEDVGVSPIVIADILERVIQHLPQEGQHLSDFVYHAGELLDFLEKSSDIEETRVAGLEWTLLPLLEYHGRTACILHRELSRNPEFFAEVVELVYGPEDGETPELSEENLARAQGGDKLLKTWRQTPGRTEEDSLDPDALRVWVSKAREATYASGRGKICDYLVGKIFASAPDGTDGVWPDVAVRNLIEELENEEIESSMEVTIYNRRGVVTRSPDEGGEQERRLVEKYGGYADQLGDRWPRVAAVLRRIADRYVSEARQRDLEAELREDRWPQ